MPSLNPDGYELAATHKKSLNPDITEDVIGRLNANGVDLNRNFPDQFFEANTDSFEPESEAVMNWIRKYPFALSASFHSGALVVTYPFDDSPSGTIRSFFVTFFVELLILKRIEARFIEVKY